MREYCIKADEGIKIHSDTIWTLWFLAKDSLEEGELNQFLDIFELLKRTKTNEEDTKLAKNLSTIMKSLTNRYQKYLTNISTDIKGSSDTEKGPEEKPLESEMKKTKWEERLKEIRKSYPRAYRIWNDEKIETLKTSLIQV